MKLTIDGCPVEALPGQSLLDIIRQMGLATENLSGDPLVAKIAGEIFTLNYIPVRQKDALPDRTSIRRAMAASGGMVHLLRYGDPTGRDAYVRTAQFLVFLALRQLWPQSIAKMNHTIGSAVYISVSGAENFSVEKLKQQVRAITAQNIPLLRRRISTCQAIEDFRTQGQTDKAELLAWRQTETLDLYSYGDFSDYYYGEMAPSTGYLRVWDILPAEGGFLFLFPDDRNPDRVADYQDMPNFFQVFAEGQRWGELMSCKTASELNALTRDSRLRELIRVNEALHEKRFAQVADMICRQGAKVVFLAGPSSSGKTTSANRLAVQLRVHGKKPILLSLDDYYINRDEILPGGPLQKLHHGGGDLHGGVVLPMGDVHDADVLGFIDVQTAFVHQGPEGIALGQGAAVFAPLVQDGQRGIAGGFHFFQRLPDGIVVIQIGTHCLGC